MECLPCGKRSTRDHMSRRSGNREVLRSDTADDCDRQVEMLVRKELLSEFKIREHGWTQFLLWFREGERKEKARSELARDRQTWLPRDLVLQLLANHHSFLL